MRRRSGLNLQYMFCCRHEFVNFRSMAEATYPLSIVFALQGIAAALGGKWALDVS